MTNTIFDKVICDALVSVCTDVNVLLVSSTMAFNGFHKSMRVIVMGMIWSELPVMYPMMTFIGTSFAGATANSHAFFVFNSSTLAWSTLVAVLVDLVEWLNPGGSRTAAWGVLISGVINSL